jgi:hypothetical protein
MEDTILSKQERGRRNRRAPGASSGGKTGDDGSSRPEATCFSPVGGDRQIADCSAVNPRRDLSASARSSLRICVICVICGQYARAVFVPSCLRVCDVRDGSVSGLCALCASVVQPVVGGLRARFQIHLRIHGIKRHCRFELGERNLVVDGMRMEFIGRTKTDGRDAKKARSGASVGGEG